MLTAFLDILRSDFSILKIIEFGERANLNTEVWVHSDFLETIIFEFVVGYQRCYNAVA